MASLTKKGDYWRLSFYNSKRNPKQKELYYKRKDIDPREGYTRNEMLEIKRDLEYEYKHDKWNPWDNDNDPASKNSITLKKAIEIYIKKENRRLAKETMDVREVMLKALLRDYGNRELTALAPNFWEQYINEPKKYKTREARRSIIYALYKRIRKEGYQVPLNIEIIGKRKEKKLRSIVTSEQWLTVKEMESLITAIPEYADHRVKKAKSKHASPRPVWWMEDIIRLGFYTGMRRSDLFAIRPSWVREDYKVVRIGGAYEAKSQLPEEIMPTIPEARPILKKLVDGSTDDKPFFHDRNAEHASKTFKALVRYKLKHKSDSIWFHCLRHSFVMYCMDELKLRDRLIMQLTRHKDERSLRKYKHHNVNSAIDELDNLT